MSPASPPDRNGYRSQSRTANLAKRRPITVRANWRIIVRFANGGADEIELIDDH